MNSNSENFQKLLDEQRRISNNITVSVEIISPEMATKYLQKNLRSKTTKNRKIDTRTVNRYVEDILNNRWKVGVPILFDSNDSLVDGQTRCGAVVKAKKSIVAITIRGLDPDIFNSLDCGKKRTPKDVLSCIISDNKQLTKPNSVSAGISLMYNVAKNYKSIDKNRIITNPEFFEIVTNGFDFYDEPFVSGKIPKWRKNIKLSVAESVLTGFYYTNKTLHGAIVDEFLNIITSNDVNTPLIVREFRDMMVENKGKKSDEKGYLPPYKVYRFIDLLFKLYLEKPDFKNRKHFSKIDLNLING